MQTFIAILDFTEHGIRNLEDSARQSVDFISAAAEAGVSVQAQYWTTGPHDGVVILKGPDERTVSSLLLSLRAQGHVHTQLLRAFDRAEIEAILAEVAEVA